jgi:putative membrane protein
MIIFWIGILSLIVWAVTRYRSGDTHHARLDNSLEIARQRYANGEITREEFEQIKRDLS